MNRLAPAVEAPYGTPRKVLTPWKNRPRTRPEVVSTILLGPPARVLCPARASAGRSSVPAAAAVERWRNERRFMVRCRAGLKTRPYVLQKRLCQPLSPEP